MRRTQEGTASQQRRTTGREGSQAETGGARAPTSDVTGRSSGVFYEVVHKAGLRVRTDFPDMLGKPFSSSSSSSSSLPLYPPLEGCS